MIAAGTAVAQQQQQHEQQIIQQAITNAQQIQQLTVAPAQQRGAAASKADAQTSDGLPPMPETISPPRPIEPGDRIVELALCLDTSGSMDGLINAARTKLWEIVNDLALAKPTPRLRVALLTYGNNGHNAQHGWVNVDVAFTEDLDLVSQRLFSLTTNGGTELVGRVLKTAGERLDWNASDDVLKLIIVAGNETADQDTTFNYRDVCKSIISSGVMINSIYCGNVADDIAPGWKEVAMLADGHFASIDHNNGTITISTPYDDELVTLSATMNRTYLAFGAQGTWSSANQTAQDGNAAAAGAAVAAQRAITKNSVLYCNAHWDLVDACKMPDFKLEDIKDEDLPEEMRGMTLEQKKAHIAKMEQERNDIQRRVADLQIKRGQFVEAELKKTADAEGKSFDAAIRTAIRAQAASKGFTFEEPKPVVSN